MKDSGYPSDKKDETQIAVLLLVSRRDIYM